MKTRFFSTLLFVLALAFSISLAAEKPSKSTKTSTAKKEMKSCCVAEKDAKGCSDKDMKNCVMKDAKASKSGVNSDTKEAGKTATESDAK
ncbi:MAG: hypothetical protein ABI623_04295 [bacterium]